MLTLLVILMILASFGIHVHKIKRIERLEKKIDTIFKRHTKYLRKLESKVKKRVSR